MPINLTGWPHCKYRCCDALCDALCDGGDENYSQAKNVLALFSDRLFIHQIMHQTKAQVCK